MRDVLGVVRVYPSSVILVVLWVLVLAACGGDVKVWKLHNLSTDNCMHQYLSVRQTAFGG